MTIFIPKISDIFKATNVKIPLSNNPFCFQDVKKSQKIKILINGLMIDNEKSKSQLIDYVHRNEKISIFSISLHYLSIKKTSSKSLIEQSASNNTKKRKNNNFAHPRHNNMTNESNFQTVDFILISRNILHNGSFNRENVQMDTKKQPITLKILPNGEFIQHI